MVAKRDMQVRGCVTLLLVAMLIIYFSWSGDANDTNSASESSFTRSAPASSSSSREETRYGILKYEGEEEWNYGDRSLDFTKQETVESYCNGLDARESVRDRNLQSVLKTRELLDTYIREHHESTLPVQGNDLCQSEDHSFVVGTYSCPTQLGARMHEFLNAFAGAVITNRTLMWHYCDRDSCHAQGRVDRCDTMIQRKAWMASAESVTMRLKKGGCPKKNGYVPRYSSSAHNAPYSRRKLAGLTSKTGGQYHEPKSVSGSGLVEQTVVPPSRRYGDAEGLIACCGIDSLPKRVLDFGILERQEMYGLVLPGSHLGPAASERARTLFAAGSHQAYGLLFRYAFEYSPDLEAFNAKAVEALRGTGERREAKRARRRRLQRASGGGPPRPTPPPHFLVNYTARYEQYGPTEGALRPSAGGLHPSRRTPTAAPTTEGEIDVSTKKEEQKEGGEEAGGPFVLAVHVRHMQGKDSGDRDVGGAEMKCVKQMLALHVPHLSKEGQGQGQGQEGEAPPCRVLLASDREATLTRLKADISALGCEVLVANHQVHHSSLDEAAKARWTPLSASGVGGQVYGLVRGGRGPADKARAAPPVDQRPVSGVLDHGPYRDSFASIADVHLLSRAHAFIGSSDDRVLDRARARPLSLYSSLVAGLVSSGDAHLRRREAYEQRQNGGKRSDNALWERWLPGCAVSFGSYVPPEKHSPVRTPDRGNVSVGYERAYAEAFSEKLRREAEASLVVHRHGPSLGGGQYAPGFCASFAWGGKCYSLRHYKDLSPVCSAATRA